MTDSKIVYGLAALCFLPGFAVLLMQKVYIDSQTNQPTEVELPILGKLKTKTICFRLPSEVHLIHLRA